MKYWFLSELCFDFGLGKMLSFKKIEEGYQTENISLKTQKGKYLVKIFPKPWKDEQIKDQVWVLQYLAEQGIPVTKIKSGRSGYIYRNKMGSTNIKAIVIEWIDGKMLRDVKNDKEIIISITKGLARLHGIKNRVHNKYDSWGPTNLLAEFKSKGKYLVERDLELISPIVSQFMKVNQEKLPKSLIHGTPESQNIIVKNDGSYVFLDFGCMDYNGRIYDLAIFLAFSCFNLSEPRDDIKTYNSVLETYQKYHKLTDYELRVLPLFIKVSFAAMLVGTNYSLKVEKEKGKGIEEWYERAKRGLGWMGKLSVNN